MEDSITYGVFWKTKDSNKWLSFSSWHVSYDSAMRTVKDMLEGNPNCIAIKIVERTETFFDVWEKEQMNECGQQN